MTLRKQPVSSGPSCLGCGPAHTRARVIRPHSPCLLATLPCIRSPGPAPCTPAVPPASCLALGPARCPGLRRPARCPRPVGSDAEALRGFSEPRGPDGTPSGPNSAPTKCWVSLSLHGSSKLRGLGLLGGSDLTLCPLVWTQLPSQGEPGGFGEAERRARSGSQGRRDAFPLPLSPATKVAAFCPPAVKHCPPSPATETRALGAASFPVLVRLPMGA